MTRLSGSEIVRPRTDTAKNTEQHAGADDHDGPVDRAEQPGEQRAETDREQPAARRRRAASSRSRCCRPAPCCMAAIGGTLAALRAGETRRQQRDADPDGQRDDDGAGA